MATARTLHPETPPTLENDAWSKLVMVYAGQTFNWTIKRNEADSVTVSPVSGGTWPLSSSSYTVTPQSPQSATVNTGTEGNSASFQCSPASPNAPQTLLVAVGVYDTCQSINSPGIAPGQCYAWQNNTDKNIVVKGTGTWPPAQVVKKNGGIVFGYVPTDGSVPKGNYPLSVTFEHNGNNACTQQTAPVIIVTSPTMY